MAEITNTKGFLLGLKAKIPPEEYTGFMTSYDPREIENSPRFDDMFIGDTRVIPRAEIEGSVMDNEKVLMGKLDGEDLFKKRDRVRAQGNIGLDFVSPSSMVENKPTVFGVGASGQYFTQADKFPDELKKFGFPEKVEYGKGLTVDQLQAYLNTPITENLDLDVNARINPYYVDPVDGQMLGKDKFIGAKLRYNF